MLNIQAVDDFIKTNQNFVFLVNNKKQIINYSSKLESLFKSFTDKFLDQISFEGKFGNTTFFNYFEQSSLNRFIILGVGDAKSLTDAQIQKLGTKFFYFINRSLKISTCSIFLPKLLEHLNIQSFAKNFLLGAVIASYKFDKYKSDKKENDFQELVLVSEETLVLQNISTEIFELAQGVSLARDLANEPANCLNPDDYASVITNELSQLGVDVQVLSEIEMRRLSMNALLAVGQGSINESKTVVMRYTGNSESSEILGLVGKGVTFDTGGISLKPSSNMHHMKFDMAGSAAIVGLMKTLALRQAKVNVVAVVGLVENMPGSNAQRPGDIVQTMSGKTVEVLNTDAEGRLVLCDCMHYLQSNFQVTQMIDLATLTGAVLVALGNSFAGCFANNDQLAQNLSNAGIKTGERIWRLPLDEEYKELIASNVADIANISKKPAYAGSATAAEFLAYFIQDGVQWAHLDIAGMSQCYGVEESYMKAFASGFGVKLLNQFIQDYWEK